MTNAIYQSSNNTYSNGNSNNFNQRLEVTRGDIYLADLGMTKGSIQGGERPVIIISNRNCNNYSGVIHIVPITSRLNKKKLPTHIEIPSDYGLDLNSIALCEQQQPINKFSLKYKIGRCSDELMIQINKGLKIQLDLMEDETFGNTSTRENKSSFPPSLRHNTEVFDMNKAKQLAKVANEWEEFMNKNKNKGYDLSEVQNTIDNYLSELASYCKKFNQSINKFYHSKIEIMGYENGDGFNARIASC